MSSNSILTVNKVMTVDRFHAQGLSLRDVQRRVALDVEKTLAHKPIPPKTVVTRTGDPATIQRSVVGLIEAGTGTGKTLAYLIPLLLHQMRTGQQVAVSTFTRALQRQIAADDLRKALALTGSTARVALLMGRTNFIARSRVLALHERLDEEDRRREDWRAFYDWVQSWDEQTAPMDTTFAAWREHAPDLPILHGHEMVEDMVSLDDGDDEADAFWFQQHRKQAVEAQIIITNHASLLVHTAFRGGLLDGLGAVVIDEADRLHSAARALLQRRIRWDLLLARARRREPDKITASAKSHVEAIQNIMSGMGTELAFLDTSVADLAARLPERCRELLDHLRVLQIPLSQRDAEPVEAIVDALKRALEKRAVEDDAQAITLTFSPVRRLPAFAIDPIDSSDLVKRLFGSWNGTPIGHIILTSATLSDLTKPSSSDPMKSPILRVRHNYGIDEDAIPVSESHEPSRYGRMTFVLPDPRVASPILFETDENQYLVRSFSDAWSAYVNQAIDTQKERRKLVLAGSFVEIEKLIALRTGATLHDKPRTVTIDGVVFHQPDMPGHKLMGLLQDPAIRAIVTPSFWEGVNLVVDKKLWMQDLLITRIPIPPYNPVLQERIVAHLLQNRKARDRGEVLQRLFVGSTADALRKLRQGIGRGIRGERDVVRVWILDPRVMLPANWQSAAIRMDDDIITEKILLAAENNKDRYSRHPALQYWSNSVPSRFRGELDVAEMFTQDGNLLQIESMEVA